jgi:hypothetical protein
MMKGFDSETGCGEGVGVASKWFERVSPISGHGAAHSVDLHSEPIHMSLLCGMAAPWCGAAAHTTPPP